MNKFDELYGYLNEIHSELEPIINCKEDFSNWIADNWFVVEDNIAFALQTMVVDSKKDMNDLVDRHETVEFISERIKEGLLNVIETYEVEE